MLERTPPKLTGERLRNLRMICGLTQAELADKLNYHEDSLARFERGESTMPADLLSRLKPVLIAHMQHVGSILQEL